MKTMVSKKEVKRLLEFHENWKEETNRFLIEKKSEKEIYRHRIALINEKIRLLKWFLGEKDIFYDSVVSYAKKPYKIVVVEDNE